MADTSKLNSINPKKLIVDYIESLVTHEDIYAEELLKRFSKTDVLQTKVKEEDDETMHEFEESFRDKKRYGRQFYNDRPYFCNLNFEINNSTSKFDESEPILV